MAAQRKAEALARCGRPGTESGWRFLTGTEPAARDLCRSVGFHYSFDPATGLYSHPTGIVVLTPEGRVSKYFLGVEYPARDVRLALVEASNGKIGSVTDGLLLLCSRYDPATGHYGLAVIRLVRYAGMLTLVALAAFVFRARFREARRASAGGL
jgi:protein SCO1/2